MPEGFSWSHPMKDIAEGKVKAQVETKTEKKTWWCKIGEVDPSKIPHGGDLPMRNAIEEVFKRLTGEEPLFTFSGWGGELTENERAVVENRLPRHSS